MKRPDHARLPPSLLARKILCTAYLPAPLSNIDRLKFLGLHAMNAIRVIVRHLHCGYRLLSIESGARGYRIDLLFVRISTGKRRLVEVKSSRRIREVHKIQAALYHAYSCADEIVISNRESDELLNLEYVQEIRRRAEFTHQILINDPEGAERTFTPHEDCCYICANKACRFARTRAVTSIEIMRGR